MNTRPQPGARIRLTGEFLRNTGQFAGREANGRWTVVPCDCELCAGSAPGRGEFVAVNEQYEYMPERARHFNIANIETIRSR